MQLFLFSAKYLFFNKPLYCCLPSLPLVGLRGAANDFESDLYKEMCSCLLPHEPPSAWMNWINVLEPMSSHCAEYYSFLGTKVLGDEVDTNPVEQRRCCGWFVSVRLELQHVGGMSCKLPKESVWNDEVLSPSKNDAILQGLQLIFPIKW